MKIYKTLLCSLIAIGVCSVNTAATALTFAIQPNSDIVGSVRTITVQRGESFATIGAKFDVGVYELIEANPGVDLWEPDVGKVLIIPTQYVLPSGPRRGIVINLAEMRLYYFHRDGRLVSTYPIGIGRKEWETPIGTGKVLDKTKDPYWRPPDSIRAWYVEHDKDLPKIIPPGPDNPLGKYALRLSFPGYLIHGTNSPASIGLRSSSGCIRLHPADIESLFYKVSVGDPVRIVHQPYKIGRYGNQVYIEAHEPLSGAYYNSQSDSDTLKQALEAATMAGTVSLWSAKRAADHSYGYPSLIELN